MVYKNSNIYKFVNCLVDMCRKEEDKNGQFIFSLRGPKDTVYGICDNTSEIEYDGTWSTQTCMPAWGANPSSFDSRLMEFFEIDFWADIVAPGEDGLDRERRSYLYQRMVMILRYYLND